MFAHEFCHIQIEILSNSIDFNRKDRATRGALAAQALGAAGAPAPRERLPQIFNFQYSIVNSGLSGLGFSCFQKSSLRMSSGLTKIAFSCTQTND
jgi:hypothetical protein